MLRTQRPIRLLAALVVTACAAIFASPASAGSYLVKSCNQSPTHSLSGWSFYETAGGSNGVPYFWHVTDCAGVGMHWRFENSLIAAGATSAWTFHAPAGTWIEAADLYQSATPSAPGSYDSVYAELENGDRRTVASAIAGAQSTLRDASYTLPADAPHAVRLRTELGCNTGSNCDGTQGNEYWLLGMVMHLRDPSNPAIDAVSGAGWQAEPVDGVQTISYGASDAGSGLSEVRFVVDGIEYVSNASQCTAGAVVPCPLSASGSFALDTTRLSEGAHTIALVGLDFSGNATPASARELTIMVRRPPALSAGTPVSTSDPSANGGGSPTVGDQLQGNPGSWSGSDIAYSYQWMRCDATGLNCVPIDGATSTGYKATTADIGHTLSFCVTATNSGGSVTSCSAPTPAVIAAPPTSAGTADRPGDVTPVGSSPASSSGSGGGIDRGHPNGTPAADKVVLTALINSRSLTQKVKFGKRVPISGRLVGPNGAPIAGATLTVQVQTAVPGASMADAAQVVTGAEGRFSYTAPAGPSRVVRFGYRSYSADSSFADTTDVRLLVSAGVTMKAKPKKVHNRHATVFTGRVLGGPVPARGVVVDLQVFYRKQWRTFAAPRTNRRGAYRFKYRFMAGPATWKFRARVRADGRYPYAQGYSAKTVKVKVVR